MVRSNHVYGGATVGLFGTLSYAVYNAFNFVSSLLLFCGLLLAVIWKVGRYYQNRKRMEMFVDEEQENEQWVHLMSQFNVGIEVGGLFISVVAMILLEYQLDEE